MVAYSFKARFAEPILAGTKGGTIRAARRQPRKGQFQHSADRPGGHARPGEELHLYTGMRIRQCRLIARKRCISTEEIYLDFASRRVCLGNSRIWLYDDLQLDVFACFDGFADFDDMTEFWRDNRAGRLLGDKGPTFTFTGWHIRWLPLPEFTHDQARPT